VFFEATGAAKGAKVLQVANPRTAGFLIKSAKASWNTAVGFGLWSASQGEEPKDIAESTATGAVLGPFGKMLQTMFKFGGRDVAKVVINDAVNKASEGHGSYFPTDKKLTPEELSSKINELLKSVKDTEAAHKAKTVPFAEVVSISPLTPESKVASSAISIRLHELAKDKYGKTFDKLPWIQQRGIINKFMANDALAAQIAANNEKPSAEVLHTMIKEQQDKLNQVSPTAAEVDKKVGEFVKASGQEPIVQKIKATMPHHNTSINSLTKDVHARISFLSNQLRSEKNEASKEEIRQAIKEEKGLLIQIREKNAKKSKPGAALINDTIAFKGDDYLVRPAEKSDAAIFSTWREDKFAGDVYKKIVAESPVGMMDRKAQAIMTSMQAGNMLEMFAKDRFQDTIVLHHNQYGPIGGANFSVTEDRGGKLGKTLMLNWIALRPNVVAKVYDTPGAGQSLFLHILEKARVNNAGVELHSAPSAEDFYRRMGMEDAGDGNFKYTPEKVKDVLKQKGLIMALIGTGVGTWAATPDQLDNSIQAQPKEQK
jgi:Ni,Fe-hydrogenase maturation factor